MEKETFERFLAYLLKDYLDFESSFFFSSVSSHGLSDFIVTLCLILACSGDYVLIVFDLHTLGTGLKMDPYQIGAHTALGESFLRSVPFLFTSGLVLHSIK